LIKNTNKHGLKRYVPTDVKRKIRKDAGFGCVICGCVLVDYEHIHPEYSDAKEHDSEKMTLLCLDCHGRVTRKLISKKTVWEAKSKPKALQNGYVHDVLFVNTDELEIKIGNSTSKFTKTILTIHGKPIIWFEPPSLEGEPSKLCAIFHNANGKPISYINRNQFTALTNNQDVKSESTELSIFAAHKECLVIDRKGDSVLEIKKMEGGYLNTSVLINPDGALIIKQGESNLTLSKFHVENCGSAIHLGDPPSQMKYNKLVIAMIIARNTNVFSILNCKGKNAGWLINNEFLNKKYELVGTRRKDDVYNICDEFIGRHIGSYIVHKNDCYNSGEPIYTSQESINFRDLNPELGYDISFRLFGDGI
jgi:hypothetical protein